MKWSPPLPMEIVLEGGKGGEFDIGGGEGVSGAKCQEEERVH